MEGEAVLRKVSITQRQFGLHCVDSQVQKGNSTLAKLRSAKACEKAAKGNGSVAAHAFPSYHNFVSIVPPADRTRANLALCRAPLRGDARKLTA